MKRNLLKSTLVKLSLALAATGIPALACGQTVLPLPGTEYAYPGDDAYTQLASVETASHLVVSDSGSSGNCVSPGCTSPAGGLLGDDDDCCSRGLWGTVDYMFVWTKGRTLPPLVTTSTNPLDEGVLGRPTTTVLFGGDKIGRDLQSGARIFAGKWLGDDDSVGAAIRFMGLEGDRSNFHQSSLGNPLLAVPFFNADPLVAAPDSVMAATGAITGSIGAKTSNDVYSTEALLRVAVRRAYDYRIDLIGGYHNTVIDDGLAMNTILQQGATLIHFRDDFNARNEFHGGSIGFLAERGNGPWTASLLAKISVGRLFEEVRINGENVTNVGGGAPAIAAGGIFAQPTNIGTYFRHDTIYVPEIGLNANRQLNDHWDFSIGYTFMYWSKVVLAGDQIDTTIDGGLLQGGAGNGIRRPLFQFRETDFFLHAMTFGLNYRY